MHISRESKDSPDEGWVVVSVEQINLEEFFVGKTDTGRTMRLYAKSTSQEALMDTEGTPFEIARGFRTFGTLDGQPIAINRMSVSQGSAALVLTPTGPIGAVAPRRDPAEAREALTRLAQKAPIGGWLIDCIAMDVDDQRTHTFTMKVSNELAETDVKVHLPATVAALWETQYGRPLQEVVIANEQRRLRSWPMSKIEAEGSHTIWAGLPLT